VHQDLDSKKETAIRHKTNRQKT